MPAAIRMWGYEVRNPHRSSLSPVKRFPPFTFASAGAPRMPAREVQMFDAEGTLEYEPCPQCGSVNTITYTFEEGFTELECQACGYRSDEAEIAALQRFSGDLLESDDNPGAPVPIKKIKA